MQQGQGAAGRCGKAAVQPAHSGLAQAAPQK
jgi:hypothetical protein